MKMTSFICCLGAVFICLPASAIVQNAQSQQPSLSSGEVDSIVRKFQSSYADTFDRRDAKGMAALFTDDATFQNEGDVTQGRATIEANLVRLMAKLPAGTRLEDKATSSRAIAPEVIACHGTSHRIASNGTSTEMYFVRGCWCDKVIDGCWQRRKLRAHLHSLNLPHSPSDLLSSRHQRLRKSFTRDSFVRDVRDNRLRGSCTRG